MLRIIGILTGAALAIALLIIAVGVPRFSEPGPEVEPLVSELEQLASPEPETTAEPDPDPAPAIDTPAPPAPDPTATRAAAALSEPDADLGFGGWQPEPELLEPPDEREAIVAAADLSEPAAESAPASSAENWYAFWSPFRSEIAANGFVSRLQETTGMDYRVVKVKTGVYEVAFAYTDDADIEDKLARISSATGLDMSGG